MPVVVPILVPALVFVPTVPVVLDVPVVPVAVEGDVFMVEELLAVEGDVPLPAPTEPEAEEPLLAEEPPPEDPPAEPPPLL